MLYANPHAARSVLVKDEALRSPLGSFKALGAPIALMRLPLREDNFVVRIRW